VRAVVLKAEKISPEDLDIVQIIDQPEEIVKTIKRTVIT
jgi:hypothetical protein